MSDQEKQEFQKKIERSETTVLLCQQIFKEANDYFW